MSARPQAATAPIGPGRIVAVVGPSGAGKDTLIRAARDRLAGEPDVVFPRRIVTRPASADEDNEACDTAAFAARARAGGFAVAWQAHGLSYGLPVAIDRDIAAGRTVVCNVSRAVLGELRSRYEALTVIEVTAPPKMLRDRLAARARAAIENLDDRLMRSAEIGSVAADVTIENAGAIEAACELLLRAIRSTDGA